MSKKKQRKNWKRMQKAAKKTYGDYGFSLNPAMTYEDFCNMLGISNQDKYSEMQKLIHGNNPTTHMSYSYKGPDNPPFLTKSYDEKNETYSPQLQTYGYTNDIPERYCRIKESELFNLIYQADMNALYSFNSNGTNESNMGPDGTIGICYKDGNLIRCMSTKSIPFKSKDSGEYQIESFDREVSYFNGNSANDILMNACFHKFGLVSKPDYSNYELMYISSLDTLFRKYCEVLNNKDNNTMEEFSKRLLSHNILLVRACDFKIWSFAVNSIYLSSPSDICKEDLTFMSSEYTHSGYSWNRFSGAYLFNPQNNSCYKFGSIITYGKKFINLLEIDFSSGYDSSYKKEMHPDWDDFYKINPDDIVMIVYAGNHDDVDSIINLADMSTESIIAGLKAENTDNDEEASEINHEGQNSVDSSESEYARSIQSEKDSALTEHTDQMNPKYSLSDDQKDGLNTNLKDFHQESNS